MSGSQTKRLAQMLRTQSGKPVDISQLGYKEMHIDQLFAQQEEKKASKKKTGDSKDSKKKLLDSESDEEIEQAETSRQ